MIAPQMEEEFEVCPVKSNFLCPACVGKVLTFLGANVGANVASNTCRNITPHSRSLQSYISLS